MEGSSSTTTMVVPAPAPLDIPPFYRHRVGKRRRDAAPKRPQCDAVRSMWAVTHYQALGVAPDASPEDIRRAYLRLAREHHPDRHAAAGTPAGRDGAEARMREVNAAWAVLGDEARRADYDRRVLRREEPDAAPVVHRPSTDFTPIHEHDEDDDDSWRYEPDEYDPRTALGRLLTMGPPLLVVVGLGLLAVSLVVGLRPLAAAALACLLLAGVLFVGAPMVAVFKSQINEHDRGPGGR